MRELRDGVASDAIDWAALEAAMHRDPGGRGLASYRKDGRTLDEGELRRAAETLSQRTGPVAIVTGFAIIGENRVASETDGPPGALYLARALRSLERPVTLVTDRLTEAVLRAGLVASGLSGVSIAICPFRLPRGMTTDEPAPSAIWPEPSAAWPEPSAAWPEPAAAWPEPAAAWPEPAAAWPEPAAAWIDEFLARPENGKPWDALVAIERVGPSHTPQSLARQSRVGAVPLEEFTRLVPEADYDVRHSMRGHSVDSHTAPLDAVFERVAEDGVRRDSGQTVKQERVPFTVGIGDGGNEIGTGRFAWEDVCEALGDARAARIVCRIVTDATLVAGVSNWGAYALGLAVAALGGGIATVAPWRRGDESRLIEALVAAGAVDGVTGRAEATVDGLDPHDYFAVFDELRRSLGLSG